jgi:aldose 1-epimerase
VSEYGLRAGDYSAAITARAGALRNLRYRGRDLIVPFPEGGPIPDYRGIIAAPWPNRIRDGKYAFDGHDYEVPVNESERGCALHGLVFPLDWRLVELEDSALSLAVTVEPTTGYPYRLDIQADYRLSDKGLYNRVTVVNTGGTAAPYGVCPHPYLVAGPSPLNTWTLEVPAQSFLEVSRDRLLPERLRSVHGHDFDYRSRRPIGTTEIDHAFTDIDFDGAGKAHLVVKDPTGTGVGMSWDRTCQWLQIHTADKASPASNRLGLAVEPMTCPPDAFNSGEDLVRLEPGRSHSASWTIFAT